MAVGPYVEHSRHAFVTAKCSRRDLEHSRHAFVMAKCGDSRRKGVQNVLAIGQGVMTSVGEVREAVDGRCSGAGY